MAIFDEMHRNYIFCMLTGIFAAFFIPEARAEFFLHHWENHRAELKVWQITEKVGYYSSNSNFDNTGTRAQPAGLNNYARTLSDLHFVYGAHTRTNVFGRLSWARAEIDAATTPGVGFGLADQMVGVNYRLFEDKAGYHAVPISLDLQLQAEFPMYSNATANTNFTPFLGDGSLDTTAGAFFTYPLGESRDDFFALTGGAGLTLRSGGFSSTLPWSVSAKYSARDEGFLLEAGAAGMLSLKTDANANSPTAQTAGTGSGGSLITSAINPSIASFRGSLGYQLPGNLGFSLSGTYPFWGQSAPVGFAGFFGIHVRLGKIRSENPVKLSPKDYGRSNQGLVAYAGEAKVLRVNDRLNVLKIDKGSQDGVEVGQIFDIFKVKKDGSIEEAVARAKVTTTKSGESVLTIVEYFKEVWIDEGFVAKRPLQ